MRGKWASRAAWIQPILYKKIWSKFAGGPHPAIILKSSWYHPDFILAKTPLGRPCLFQTYFQIILKFPGGPHPEIILKSSWNHPEIILTKTALGRRCLFRTILQITCRIQLQRQTVHILLQTSGVDWLAARDARFRNADA